MLVTINSCSLISCVLEVVTTGVVLVTTNGLVMLIVLRGVLRISTLLITLIVLGHRSLLSYGNSLRTASIAAATLLTKPPTAAPFSIRDLAVSRYLTIVFPSGLGSSAS